MDNPDRDAGFADVDGIGALIVSLVLTARLPPATENMEKQTSGFQTETKLISRQAIGGRAPIEIPRGHFRPCLISFGLRRQAGVR
jgi:hypothetical protein